MLTDNPLLVLPFIAALLGGCAASPDQHIQPTPPPERLFLQQVASDSAIVKWRGEAGEACFNKKFKRLDKRKRRQCVTAIETEGNHKEARFTNLKSNTDYYYSVGSTVAESQRFHTAPKANRLPKDGSTHIWIVGDSGTATMINPLNGEHQHAGEAAAVRDGFLSYNATHGNEPIDLFLLLGDNAYNEGTDAQWQAAVFELYPNILTQAPVWPTIGNHEMGAATIHLPPYGEIFIGGVSRSSDPNSYVAEKEANPTRVPYLDIFTLPSKGEVGGVASGTEQYYSFDYGNVHVVSLDSQLSARDKQQRTTMRKWLVEDLSNNNLDWTIVIFHHPPYTKGSHDSDAKAAKKGGIDTPIVDMREEFTPVFEDYGVDLVYSGHSHSYERSYYLTGHTGDANTFDPAAHVELNAAGEPASGQEAEAYAQVSTGSKVDDKVVYTVAGSSGHVSLRGGKLDH
ncbi:MAG: metallophosphoesterase, partial [Pseudomonadales bacterium]